MPVDALFRTRCYGHGSYTRPRRDRPDRAYIVATTHIASLPVEVLAWPRFNPEKFMLKHPIVEFDFRNPKCRFRVRLTLGAILVLAAIIGNPWSRRLVDRYLSTENETVEKP